MQCFFCNVKINFKFGSFRTVYVFAAVYSHLLCLFVSISIMGDQDLLEEINIGKSNLAKAIMSGNKDAIEKVGFLLPNYMMRFHYCNKMFSKVLSLLYL